MSTTSINVTAEAILSYLSAGSKSATELSRCFGYSRKNETVCKMIDTMIKAGTIEADTTVTGFVAYKKVNLSDVLYEIESVSFEIPANLHGYQINKINTGFDVTLPSGNCYSITKTQRILVINFDTNYLVHSPEEVLGCIQSYATDKGFSQYLIKDIHAGKAIRADELNYNPVIIFLSVERHSKAGC